MCVRLRTPQSTSTHRHFISRPSHPTDRYKGKRTEFIEFISGHAFRLHTFIKVTGKRSVKALFISAGRSPFSCGEEACILTCLLPSFVFWSLVWVFCLVHNSFRKSRVSAGREANAFLSCRPALAERRGGCFSGGDESTSLKYKVDVGFTGRNFCVYCCPVVQGITLWARRVFRAAA